MCENEQDLHNAYHKLTKNPNGHLTQNDEVTGKQLKFMQKNNIPIPEGVTKTQASDMIQKYIDDHKEKKE